MPQLKFLQTEIDKLEKCLDQGFPIFKTSENKEIFLVIGNLGAGKSTTINYFMGNKMGLKKIDGKDRVVVTERGAAFSEDEIPSIGHNQFSHTLHARSHEALSKEITFCDCPGFQPRRMSVAERLCESVGVEISIKLAKTIRGVLVVIDYNEFFTVRGSSFNHLINTLTRLFGSNIETACASLFFIITKAPTDKNREEVKTDLLTTITASIQLAGSSVSDFYRANPNTEEDRDQIVIETEEQLNFLKLIERHKDHFIIIDVLDNGNSKNEIFNAIVKLPPIPIGLFDFKKYDDKRVEFNKMFYEIIDLTSQKMKNFHSNTRQLISLKTKLQNYFDKIKFSQGQISFLKGEEIDIDSSSQLKKQQQALNDQMINNFESINLLLDSIKEIDKQIKIIKEDLELIDSEEHVKYWEDSIFEERNSWLAFGFFGWTVKQFSYDKRVPIQEVVLTTKNGTLVEEKLEKNEGIYTSTYKSDYGKNGDAKVEIYVQSRYEPGNVRRIVELKKDLTSHMSKRQAVFDKIKELEDEIKELRRRFSEIGNEEKISEEKKQKQINQYEKEILELQELIKLAEAEAFSLQDIQKITKKNIKSKTSLFESIENVIKFISFDSALVNAFLEELKKYRETVQLMNELHVAVIKGDKELVAHFSKMPNLLNMQNDEGDTPLHFAIQSQRIDLSFILILEGASINIKNKNEKTPLDLILDIANKDEATFTINQKELLAFMLFLEPKVLTVYKFSEKFIVKILKLRNAFSAKQNEFSKPIESIIANKINPQNAISFDKSVHKIAFQEMLGFAELKPLLDITVFAVLGYHDLGKKAGDGSKREHLFIMIDSTHAATDKISLGDAENAYGVYYNRENIIYLGGKRHKDKEKGKLLTRGTLIHEINHFVANEVFKNDCKPYGKNDSKNKKRFEEICSKLEGKKDSLDEKIKAVFTYPKNQWHIELIVRISQLIAMTNSYEIVTQQCPELLEYYQTVFIPACQRHLEYLRYENRILTIHVLSTYRQYNTPSSVLEKQTPAQDLIPTGGLSIVPLAAATSSSTITYGKFFPLAEEKQKDAEAITESSAIKRYV